jgi:cell division protease FtsH
MKNLTPRRILILGLLFLTPLLLAMMFVPSQDDAEWPATYAQTAREISLSQAYDLLQDPVEGREAAILDSHIYIRTLSDTASIDQGGAPDTLTSDDTVETLMALLPFPAHDIITDIIKETDLPVQIHRNQDYSPTLVDRIIQLLPIILIVIIAVFLIRRGGMRSLGLNSSFAIVDPENIKDSFETVAGIDSARDEIQEIVDFLKDPKAASRLGGEMPKGAIFSGPPGTGKTLLARAMAREAGVPFLTIEAAGINQLFVGAGAMKIKRAFREARKQAPCIVFIDEIDAMGRARGGAQSGAGDEKETTLNALLVELDGFDGRDGVVVIAATNRPQILDKALTRRGRIDRHIHIDLPDIDGREEILKVHARKIKVMPNIDFRRVASTSFGFSGSDLRSLVNEAALSATRAGRENVTLEDFGIARDRMLVGLSGSQRRLSEVDRRKTAIHEAGHAVIAAVLPDSDPIEKATVLPQGAALGYVMQSPQEDRVFQTRDELIARIRVAVAGRVAEEICYGPGGVTSGASSDIEAATATAKLMVTRFGMSDLGFVLIDNQDPDLHDIARPAAAEIRKIIHSEILAVKSFLNEHRDRLEQIARMLEEAETVEGAVIMGALEDIRGSFSKVE